MRILVTGGSGFVGGWVLEAARERGHDVRSIDLASESPVDVVDVRDFGAVSAAMVGVDVVVHLAAKVGLEQAFTDAPEYVSHNDLGTAVVLSAASQAGVSRVVLASSMVVYGEGLGECAAHGPVRPGPRRRSDLDAGDFEPPCPLCGSRLLPALVGEDVSLDPRNVYASTKVTQEHLLSAWARQTGGTGAAMRFHNVFGPGAPRDNAYSGVASIFLSDVLAARPPQVTEDGGQRRDLVHVRDVARACIAALEPPAEPVPGTVRAYNVASGVPRTVLELATALAEVGRGPAPVVTGTARLGDVRHITASHARARDELGWTAQEDFRGSLAELFEASGAHRSSVPEPV
ncbi:MAG: NAD-dependent epimerase/dehydratase family protein [Actinobacteria bacterium]|nr:NAD-dependent epimerase/dehydratase family protein [Actinomycetota bacterium]